MHLLSGTYDDRKRLFTSNQGTLSVNIFPIFHLDGWVLEKFRTQKMKDARKYFWQWRSFINQNHEISAKWYKNKKSELSEPSRSWKLWFSYIEYIFVVQEIIWAERRNNWESHIATAKFMQILFAASGHNNYAKTCRLYIQSVEESKSINLYLYNQFQLGNYTARRIGSNWSAIWTDLSIEQILIKIWYHSKRNNREPHECLD